MRPAILFLLITLRTFAQPGPVSHVAANAIVPSGPAATNGLNSLLRTTTSSDYALMGFNSTNDVRQTTLGEPLKVFQIPLNRLSSYQPGQTFAGLLAPTPRVIYPAMVRTQAVSSIILRLDNGKWITAGLGEPKLIRVLTHLRDYVRQTFRSASRIQIPEVFAVEVPAFGLWLAGYQDPTNGLVLLSDANLRSKSHQARPYILAKSDMAELADEARKYHAKFK